jgi:NAD(P)-dependent dehydrogenase (short-subunit alcohol dehydrogenase family)
MKERVVVITGASSGIGRAAAKLFAGSGDKVFAVGRNGKELQSRAADAASLPGSVTAKIADITDTSQVDRLTEEINHETGRIDVLVNAAGILKNGTIENTSLDDWDTMMNINLRSAFYLMQRSVPLMQEAKGNIVNVSSVNGLRSFPNVLAYCVSKAGMDQLTRCAALELAPQGIRVNAVNPGVVVTNLHKRGGMSETDYEKFLDHAKTTHPMGRPGDPQEVAELIFFLASENAGWITGVTYQIDGGRGQTCAR